MTVRHFLMLLCLTAHVKSDIRLRAAGATFPEHVYKQWLDAYATYRQTSVNVNASYDAVGSGQGLALIGSPHVEFVASEIISDTVIPDSVIPVMAGALVIGYNIPDVDRLTLSRDALLAIFNGSLRSWDDPIIRITNPNAKLPTSQIIRVLRSDSSGSTWILTRALSRFSGAWSNRYGVFHEGRDETKPARWDVHGTELYVNTTRGMAALLSTVPYSVGYLSLAEARLSNITSAAVINAAGRHVLANTTSIHSAMLDYKSNFSERFTTDVTDGSSRLSYPLVGYTFMVIGRNRLADCRSFLVMKHFIEWILTSDRARRICLNLEFLPVEAGTAHRIKDDIFNNTRCNEKVIYDSQTGLKEALLTASQSRVLVITLPIITVLVPLVAILVLWKLHYYRAVVKRGWLIPATRLDVHMGETIGKTMSKCFSLHSLKNKGMSSYSLTGNWLESTDRVGMLDREQFVLLTEVNIATRINIRSKLRLLHFIESIDHVNVTSFLGVFKRENFLYFVSGFCSKGRMSDILQNDKYTLDDQLKYSLSCDIARGLCYLHKHKIYHGRLTSSACYLDHRWNVKVGDWYESDIASTQAQTSLTRVSHYEQVSDDDSRAHEMFWMPPEQLASPGLRVSSSVDVYSFAIILVEIFTRDDPYSELSETLGPLDIIELVRAKNIRPKLSEPIPEEIWPLINCAWHGEPTARPKITWVKTQLDSCKPSKKSVLDCMMEAVENYTVVLEQTVAERTYDLREAIQKRTDLLHRMLPPLVASKLAEGLQVEPEYYDSVTIFFSDIVGFTALSSSSTPHQIVSMLNGLYTRFDEVVNLHDVYKVETIGDAYMVISGAPVRNGNQHATHVADMALTLEKRSRNFVIEHRPDQRLEYRAGIHTGPVCTGVVGIKMPRYCIFGDTVNTASRIESTSVSGRIQISQATRDLLRDFHTEPRGIITAKGKGEMMTYWLLGRELTKKVSLPDGC